MELQAFCGEVLVLERMLSTAMEAFVVEAVLAVSKSAVVLLTAMCSESNSVGGVIDNSKIGERSILAAIGKRTSKAAAPENKDDGDSEDDEEDDEDEGDDQVEDGGEDLSADEGEDNEDDDADDPEANGEEGGSEDDDDDDEDDEEDDDDEDDDEEDEDEEEDEETPQPPSKKRK